MAEFKLERFKYTWKGEWTTGTVYKRDDIVRVGGKSYVCLEGHTADAKFKTDLLAVLAGSNPPQAAPRWRLMTDGRSYRGQWATATTYAISDIVEKDGSLWVCVNEHDSTTFVTNEDDWSILASHIKYTTNWQTATDYGPGALVKYNGIVYKCIEPHVSGLFLEDNLVTTPTTLQVAVVRNAEDTANVYTVNGIPKAELTLAKGKTYVFDQSAPTDGTDDTNKFFGGGLDLNGDPIANPHPLLLSDQEDGPLGDPAGTIYGNGVTYLLNGNEVTQQNYIANFGTAETRQIRISVPYTAPENLYYYCRYHAGMGGTLTIDNSAEVAWEVFHSGIEYAGAWARETLYRTNDLVLYGGSIWRCTETHQSAVLGTLDVNGKLADQLDITKFNIELPGFQYESEWSNTAEYQPGDVVRYGGYLYFASKYNRDDQPAQSQDSTQSWVELQYGYNFRGDWVDGDEYNPGDMVLRGGELYMALVSIGSTEVDGSTSDYLQTEKWQLVIPSKTWGKAWLTGSRYDVGTVVYHFGNAYVCNTWHVASNDNFPGDNGSGYFYWDLLVQAGQPSGLLSLGDLLTYNLSRTNVGDGSTIGPTRVPIGEEENLLGIDDSDNIFWRDYIRTAGEIFVGVHGMDATGYGLSPDKPFRTVRHAAEYVQDTFPALTPIKIRVNTGRYIEIGPITVPAGCVVMGDELRSTTIVATPPKEEYLNEVEQLAAMWNYVESILLSLYSNIDVPALPGNTVTLNKTPSILGLSESNLTNTLFTVIKQKIEFNSESGDTDPPVTGTNIQTADVQRRQTATKLASIQEWLSQQVEAWVRQTYPDKVFRTNRIAEDFLHFFKAVVYDLRYEGTYRSVLSGERYANAITGSKLSDLFRHRDTTGLRQCTIEGLDGALNPPGVFDLYQRPTSGAFTALDPGWGPNDDSAWINRRSPYIQGVTTIGKACTGMRVNGLLHNGGNKSMTANDYTQVLSDGIGAWISDNGRAELVSVFTYYNQVGYLAERGGVIRATNGNNSYGAYGSIADGIDPNEVPTVGSVFNRDNEASVDGVFAGAFGDEIFVYEYENAGENYTTATSTITGAGANANALHEDIRHGALFQSRIVNPADSGAIGGVGYTNIQNQATQGDTTSITLNPNDTSTEDDLIGQAIYIISGTGTGQYGYIQAYNELNSTATIYKESTQTPGWDHVLPGTPIEALLESNTRYKIEPRIIASKPTFTSTNYNILNGRDIIDITFSNTTFEFTDIEGSAGTGDVETQDGLVATNATFDITKNGLNYEVTITDGGLGYAVGDTITILGSVLGGEDVTNDCIIKVASVTDDSSNSIVTVVVTGTGRSGKFVAIAKPNFALTSDTGQGWDESLLPNATAIDWIKVQAGNNRFVAIAKGTDEAAYSLDGINWTTVTLPFVENWVDIEYGEGRFVVIAENSTTVIQSADGITWTSSNMPNDAIGDSASAEWQAITYGKGKFVAVAGNDGTVGHSTDGTSWTFNAGFVDTDNIQVAGLAYGNNRYLALLQTGETYYSFDGSTWTQGTDVPTQDGSTIMKWNDMKFAEGVFFAICDADNQIVGGELSGNDTNFAATTEDGLLWTSRTLEESLPYYGIGFGVVNNIGSWIIGSKNIQLNGISKIETGAQVKVRAKLGSGGLIQTIKILDPGSGYTQANPPVFTITDNAFTAAIGWENRVGSGVLAQPSWVNRGIGYRSSTTKVTVTGDGYADNIPETNIIKVSGLPRVPTIGSQLLFPNILDDNTIDPNDLKSFRVAIATDLGDDGTGNGTKLVQFQISPRMRTEYDLVHGTNVTINENFSQCRITGHDFLDIGTGNFLETNYPDIYAGGNYFQSAPENEVYETAGGRIFYVSTDQDGNFRAGELFSVQQATGVVTISAEFFDLDGLSELSLGGVRLGGSGAVVREFSTDPTFAEDSNNVIPTQRAIATFLADRLSVGGSDLELNAIQAGQIYIGGEFNEIDNIQNKIINVAVPVHMEGSNALGNTTGLGGSYVGQMMLLRNFEEGMK